MRLQGDVGQSRFLRNSVISGGAPLIRIDLTLEGRSGGVWFLIDTGADATILHPRDARRILAEDLDTIDFDTDSRQMPGRGVGGDAQRVARHAAYTLRSADDDVYNIEMPILIARPTPSEPGDHGNWRLPSLLGRDFLRHFRFELFCGDRREVALETL